MSKMLIDNFVSEYKELKQFLIINSQISLLSTVELNFKKAFLLSCASYYETCIRDILTKFISENISDERILYFSKSKGINRQYHTYFDWRQTRNINNFLGLFGPDFKKKISNDIKQNEDLKKCMEAFLTLGQERNLLVHENFVDYSLEKTFEEIEQLNNDANIFIEYLRTIF